MLPKQVVSHRQLLNEGLSKEEITKLSASLRIFPTPFKGVYYVPLEEERKGCFIEKPLAVLSRALSLFLDGAPYYYSCETAEEFHGIRWRPSNEIHIVNDKKSGRINLRARIERNQARKTWRARKIARILQLYGTAIVFHRTKDISKAKTKQTPYGRFALKSQIRKDRKQFRCN